MFFSKTDLDLIDLITLAPLIPDPAYQFAVVYSYLARETGEDQYWDAVRVLRRSLEVLIGDGRLLVSLCPDGYKLGVDVLTTLW
jgi:hypothetical protein